MPPAIERWAPNIVRSIVGSAASTATASLADAERREDAAEDVVGGDLAADAAEVVEGVTDFQRDEFGGGGVGDVAGAGEGGAGVGDGGDVAGVQCEGRGPGGSPERDRIELLAQSIHPFAGECADRLRFREAGEVALGRNNEVRVARKLERRAVVGGIE